MFARLFKFLSPMQWIEFGVIIIVLFSVFNFGNTITDAFKEKFGMDTKASLKEQTIKQEAVIKTVVDANAVLADTIKTKDESAKVDQSVVVDKFKADVKVEDKVKTIVAKKDKTISEIKKKYDSQAQTVDTEKEMEKEVSTSQINSLWTIYCTQDNSEPTCKDHVS
jgi:hypothetical protein